MAEPSVSVSSSTPTRPIPRSVVAGHELFGYCANRSRRTDRRRRPARRSCAARGGLQVRGVGVRLRRHTEHLALGAARCLRPSPLAYVPRGDSRRPVRMVGNFTVPNTASRCNRFLRSSSPPAHVTPITLSSRARRLSRRASHDMNNVGTPARSLIPTPSPAAERGCFHRRCTLGSYRLIPDATLWAVGSPAPPPRPPNPPPPPPTSPAHRPRRCRARPPRRGSRRIALRLLRDACRRHPARRPDRIVLVRTTGDLEVTLFRPAPRRPRGVAPPDRRARGIQLILCAPFQDRNTGMR